MGESLAQTPQESAAQTPRESAAQTPQESAAPTSPQESAAQTPQESAAQTPRESAAQTPQESAVPTPQESAVQTPCESHRTPVESPTQTPQESGTPHYTPDERRRIWAQLSAERKSPGTRRAKAAADFAVQTGQQVLSRTKKSPKRKQSGANRKRVKRSPLARKRPRMFTGKKRTCEACIRSIR